MPFRKKYLHNHGLSGITSSSGDGFSAVVNPDAPPARRMMLNVDTPAGVCHRPGKAVVDMVPRACAVAEGRVAAVPPGKLVRKLRFPDDNTQWDYHSENGGVAAMCTPESDDGSCDATFAWKDLIVSVSFDEADIGRLETLQKDVGMLLQSWARAELADDGSGTRTMIHRAGTRGAQNR